MALPSLSVCREYAAERINAVVNDPGVRPWVGAGSHRLDLTPVIANPANVLMMGQGGGLVFTQSEPGVYEVHTQFVPEARGAAALQAVHDALRWMFTRTDAVEIVTKVPDGNKAALGLVRSIRGEHLFSRPNVWPTDSGPVGVGYYSKTIMQWASHADGLAETGDWFHEKLEAAKTAQGASAPIHDDDDAHDRYVGAAAEMIMAGQIVKGVNFYNHWARFAGYGLISIIGQNPILLDIGDAVLAVRDDDFEVILCR